MCTRAACKKSFGCAEEDEDICVFCTASFAPHRTYFF